MQFFIGFGLGLLALGYCWWLSQQRWQRLVAHAQSRVPPLQLMSQSGALSMADVEAYMNTGQPLQRLKIYFDWTHEVFVWLQFTRIEPAGHLPGVYRFEGERLCGGQVIDTVVGYIDYGPLVFVSPRGVPLTKPNDVFVWRERAGDQMNRILDPYNTSLLPPLPFH